MTEWRQWKGTKMHKDSSMGLCYILWESAKQIAEQGEEPWASLWSQVVQGYAQALDAMAQLANTRSL